MLPVPAPQPIPRPSPRVPVVDDPDRLLLFSSRNEHDGSTRWFAPGDDKPGENHQQAALRECGRRPA